MPKLKPKGLQLGFNKAKKAALDEVKGAFKGRAPLDSPRAKVKV